MADDWEDWEDDSFEPKLEAGATGNGQKFETKGEAVLASAKEPDSSKFAGEDEEEGDVPPAWEKSTPKPQQACGPLHCQMPTPWPSCASSSSIILMREACMQCEPVRAACGVSRISRCPGRCLRTQRKENMREACMLSEPDPCCMWGEQKKGGAQKGVRGHKGETSVHAD